VPWLPDSQVSHVLEPTPAEAALQNAVCARWPGTKPVLGRFAPWFDALAVAAATGRLSIRQHAVVRQIDVDGSGRVTGAVYIDRRSGHEGRARAPIVFLCASALESTRLLLLSRTPRSPNGIGAASGVLGRYLMDHIRIRARGTGPGLPSGLAPVQGRCIYVPRFDARHRATPQGRGFGVQLVVSPINAERSHFSAAAFGEMLPRADNRVWLDADLRDAWGIPVLKIDCAHGIEERTRAHEQVAALRELAKAANATLSYIDEVPAHPGSANHECGTARMGEDPGNSVLDPHNQCWDAKGLYITDAACFPSQGAQNPTLTILALTARACQHAVRTARQ
jgi:choline dehydrogenase-like flavoprotein